MGTPFDSETVDQSPRRHSVRKKNEIWIQDMKEIEIESAEELDPKEPSWHAKLDDDDKEKIKEIMNNHTENSEKLAKEILNFAREEEDIMEKGEMTEKQA